MIKNLYIPREISSNYKSPSVFSSNKPYSYDVNELEAWTLN